MTTKFKLQSLYKFSKPPPFQINKTDRIYSLVSNIDKDSPAPSQYHIIKQENLGQIGIMMNRYAKKCTFDKIAKQQEFKLPPTKYSPEPINYKQILHRLGSRQNSIPSLHKSDDELQQSLLSPQYYAPQLREQTTRQSKIMSRSRDRATKRPDLSSFVGPASYDIRKQ
ncbi:Hypothetical_protein [Hexamita inflata]|uniref:Hypothetical_protein n=1 Tax=Hexamita inflata TaxID=28002 RepID=A0AA86QUV4_9EUKA|nr:Hypothetical protein HINF_LOCUS14478 [Hexamita inflata]CAI9960078.1 Hypothetical protein HINF_LOCUS47723 [Hexamita inflata]